MPQKEAVDAKDEAVTAVKKIQGVTEKIVNVESDVADLKSDVGSMKEELKETVKEDTVQDIVKKYADATLPEVPENIVQLLKRQKKGIPSRRTVSLRRCSASWISGQ